MLAFLISCIEVPFGNDDLVVFGAVGRQDAIKGLDILIDAVKMLLRKRPELSKSIRVVLAGDGPEHDRCRDSIQKLPSTIVLGH